MTGGEFIKVAVVGDDGGDVDRQGADAMAIEQVVEAMAEARNHDDDFHARCKIVDFRSHLEAAEGRLKGLPNLAGLRQTARRMTCA